MDRKVVWTELDSGDIEAIVRYIARRDPTAAGRIGLGIYDRVQILQQNPEAGSILNELRPGWLAQTHFQAMEDHLHHSRGDHYHLVESGQPLWERLIRERHYDDPAES